MKPQLISIAIVAISLASCGTKINSNSSSQDSTKTSVEDTITIIDSNATDTTAENTVNIDNGSTKVQNNEHSISCNASYKNKYCGGARPTPEIEKQYNREYPLASCKIKLTNSNNAVLYAKTDANGNFSAPLSIGTWNYWLVSTPGSPIPIDMACEKYFDHSFGTFEISASTNNNINLLFSFPCNPCDPYSNMRP